MIKSYFLVHKEERLKSIVEKIVLNGHRTVIVVDKKVLGSISEGDILKALLYKKDVNITARKLMNKSFKFLKTKDKDEVKKIFQNHLVSLIPVVNSNMILKDLITLENFLLNLK